MTAKTCGVKLPTTQNLDLVPEDLHLEQVDQQVQNELQNSIDTFKSNATDHTDFTEPMLDEDLDHGLALYNFSHGGQTCSS